MPNNRQWAFLFWVLVLVVFLLLRRDTRSSVGGALRLLVSPKLLVPILGFVGLVGALVVAARRLGLWEPDLTADTVMWLLTAGAVLFGSFDKASTESHFVRRRALETFRVSAFVEVLAEVFVLTLPAEVILQPAFALLGGMSVVAEQKKEHRPVKRLVDFLIAVAGWALLLYVVVSLIDNWGALDKSHLVRQFAMPVWLTIGVLPFIYLLGVWAAYEKAFIRVNWRSGAGWRGRTRAKLVLVRSFGLSARSVGSFNGPWQVKLAEAHSFREGRQVISAFRAAQAEASREEAEAADRLIRFAGVNGVDKEGRRLDRREFDETTAALMWLATCHMGWYDRQSRYKADLFELLEEDFARRRLPEEHGIEQRISRDGQKWYAWRRTITGWVFAIGASEAPPNQWQYDGPEPPNAFPVRILRGVLIPSSSINAGIGDFLRTRGRQRLGLPRSEMNGTWMARVAPRAGAIRAKVQVSAVRVPKRVLRSQRFESAHLHHVTAGHSVAQ